MEDHEARAPHETLASLPKGPPPIPCGVAPIDDAIGGFALGCSSSIYGAPGAGKSVLSISIVGGLARALDTRGLYVAPEMSREMLKRAATIARVNLKRLVRCQEPENWEEEADDADARLVVVDSVSVMRRPQSTLRALIEFARRTEGHAIALAHLSQKGRALGPVGLEHNPDAVFRLLLNANGSRTLRTQKCRWGDACPIELG